MEPTTALSMHTHMLPALEYLPGSSLPWPPVPLSHALPVVSHTKPYHLHPHRFLSSLEHRVAQIDCQDLVGQISRAHGSA